MKAFLVSILIVFPVHSNAEIIRIAVASSLVRPLENIIRQYHSTDPGHEIKMSIGASGVLFNQITNGAPFDLFISADPKYGILLHASSHAKSTPLEFCKSTLAIWSRDSITNLTSTILKASRIGIADAELAPFGALARKLISSKVATQTLEGKLIVGNSVSQVNQFIMSGTLDIGFTASSAIPLPSGNGYWTVMKTYATINQIVILNETLTVNRFLDFLISETSAKMLNEFNLEVNNNELGHY